MMTLNQVRLNQSPILTNLLLGMGQGQYIAEKLMPRLPQALSSVMLAKVGNERFKRYNLRRAPGSETKRVEVKYDGKIYGLEQYSIEVPVPRELIREADESRRLNVGNYLDISRIAMTTASGILAQDYELDVAGLARLASTYAPGHVQALSGGTKWSAATSTPVTDLEAAGEMIRKKIGKRANRLILSADAYSALKHNEQVRSRLPNSTQTGPASLDQLRSVLSVQEIVVGDAIWVDGNDVGQDIWGNDAILAYVPMMGGSGGDISLAEPAFGFTNVIEGHPFAETPYYENSNKSWIYGATFERRANVSYNTAAFLFQNCK